MMKAVGCGTRPHRMDVGKVGPMPKAVQFVPHIPGISRGQASGLVLCPQLTQMFAQALSLSISQL